MSQVPQGSGQLQPLQAGLGQQQPAPPMQVHQPIAIPGYTSMDVWENRILMHYVLPIPVVLFGHGASQNARVWVVLGALRLCFALLSHPAYYVLWSGYAAFSAIYSIFWTKNGFDTLGETLTFFALFSSSLGGRSAWSVFWPLYFVFASPLHFHQNYLETWRQNAISQLGVNGNAQDVEYIFLFIDYGYMLAIPVPSDITEDSALMAHLSNFYFLQRSLQPLLAAFSGKKKRRIDVIKLDRSIIPGSTTKTLDLGYSSGTNEQLLRLKRPSLSRGSTTIIDDLKSIGAIAKAGQHQTALNVVRPFDGRRVSLLIMLPFTLSVSICVVWPIIAVRRFNADVQESVQTAFTVGGYVVTIGALLVALAALADTLASKK